MYRMSGSNASQNLDSDVSWNSDYLIASAVERRSKIELLIEEKGSHSPDVIVLLETACRQDPDPGIQKWARGQLEAQDVTSPPSEWPSIGNDGKVYTREALSLSTTFSCAIH